MPSATDRTNCTVRAVIHALHLVASLVPALAISNAAKAASANRAICKTTMAIACFLTNAAVPIVVVVVVDAAPTRNIPDAAVDVNRPANTRNRDRAKAENVASTMDACARRDSSGTVTAIVFRKLCAQEEDIAVRTKCGTKLAFHQPLVNRVAKVGRCRSIAPCTARMADAYASLDS